MHGSYVDPHPSSARVFRNSVCFFLICASPNTTCTLICLPGQPLGTAACRDMCHDMPPTTYARVLVLRVRHWEDQGPLHGGWAALLHRLMAFVPCVCLIPLKPPFTFCFSPCLGAQSSMNKLMRDMVLRSPINFLGFGQVGCVTSCFATNGCLPKGRACKDYSRARSRMHQKTGALHMSAVRLCVEGASCCYIGPSAGKIHVPWMSWLSRPDWQLSRCLAATVGTCR